MTTIDRNIALALLTILGLTALPMAFASSRPVFEEVIAFPIIVGVELLIYFVAIMIINPKATVGMAVGSAISFTVLRAVCSLVGGAIVAPMVDLPGGNFALPWLNPISTIIQVIVLLLAGPYLLAMAIPELVGKHEADRLRAGSMTPKNPGAIGQPTLDASPTGGFIQVFSFEELTAQLRKNPGLEGFLIYNDEGLVVWRELPMKIDVDSLTSRFMNLTEQVGNLMHGTGLSRVRRCLIESRDHHVVTASLNQNFGVILLFSARTPLNDINSRIGVITKSAREFLQWKYPSLPLTTGMTKDRVSVDMV